MIRRAVIVILAACAVLVVTGCGGDTSGNQSSDAGVDVGQPISLADCTDWNDASVEERLGTISQLRQYNGANVPGTESPGPTLDDQKAYDLFENYCSNDFARAFKLYKLYGRAAAFSDVELPKE